jgi:hypothetical protein
MRFRLGLPMLQTVSMLLILWAPWAPKAHRYDFLLRDGKEFKGWTILPDASVFDAPSWAQAMNLPAILAEIPIDLLTDAIEREEQLPDPRMRFFLFWSLGLVVWYFLGRFVEEVVQWSRTAILPRVRSADLVFAVEAGMVATLAAIVSVTGGATDSPVLAWSSAVWFTVASSVLTVRLLQVVRYRRKLAPR